MLKRIMLFLLAACLPLAAPALAEGGERPRIILMACYQQVGWGVYADAAFLDEEGGIWHYENEMGLPREDAERLELLGKTEDVEHVGQLDKRRVEEIRSLIAAIQPEEVKRGMKIQISTPARFIWPCLRKCWAMIWTATNMNFCISPRRLSACL